MLQIPNVNKKKILEEQNYKRSDIHLICPIFDIIIFTPHSLNINQYHHFSSKIVLRVKKFIKFYFILFFGSVEVCFSSDVQCEIFTIVQILLQSQ